MRNLIAITAALLAATGTSAATLTLDLDKSSYTVGENATITATLTLDGSESLPSFTGVFLEVGWDPNVASVANAGVDFAFGNGTQLVTTGPGTGGAALTGSGGSLSVSAPAKSVCSNNGVSCGFLTQTNASLDDISLDAQALVATLVLQVDAVGLLGLTIEEFFFFNLESTDLAQIDFGSNWILSGAMIPEPTTGALLALGLLGLAGARRL